MPYVILVDDNYHHMDSSYRCRDGEFATAEEAFARCRQIVDEYLDDAEKIEGRESATRLWESYKMFGEDPFIVATDVTPASFSAWSYASQRCEERTGDRIAGGRYLTRDDPEHEDYDPMA
jgi:hypothetical protein